MKYKLDGLQPNIASNPKLHGILEKTALLKSLIQKKIEEAYIRLRLHFFNESDTSSKYFMKRSVKLYRT